MKLLQNALYTLSGRLSLGWIVLLIAGLNIYWSLTLGAFGAHFQQAAGVPLLDLQNVSGVLTADAALALITQYSPEARSLYWAFFILDTLMPPLVFGSFGVLWAFLLRRFPQRLTFLAASPLILLPVGVGLFDWLENLCFVMAMAATTGDALPLVQLGQLFVTLKAACLFATFGLTPVFAVIALVSWIRSRSAPRVSAAAV
jgi:hypothetical protein